MIQHLYIVNNLTKHGHLWFGARSNWIPDSDVCDRWRWPTCTEYLTVMLCVIGEGGPPVLNAWRWCCVWQVKVAHLYWIPDSDVVCDRWRWPTYIRYLTVMCVTGEGGLPVLNTWQWCCVWQVKVAYLYEIPYGDVVCDRWRWPTCTTYLTVMLCVTG